MVNSILVDNNKLFRPTISVEFKKTHPDAVLPARAHDDYPNGCDTGYDLTSVEDVTIPANSNAMVPVGLQLANMSPDFWFRIEPKSGMGIKGKLQPHLGVIDSPYRGDLAVQMYNFGDTDWQIPKGKKFAQIIFYPRVDASIGWTDEVQASNRGANGFDSTEKENLQIK